MDVALQPGVGNRKVQTTVYTDDPKEPSRTYSLLYRTYPPVRFDQGSIDLGAIDIRGETSTAQSVWFEIYSKAESPQDALDNVEAPSPILAVVAGAPEVDLFERKSIRRTRYKLNVSRDRAATGQESSGMHSAILTGTTASGATTTVAVTWSLALPLEVTPSQVSFGLLTPSVKSDSKRVTVVSRDGVPFRLIASMGIMASSRPPSRASARPRNRASISRSTSDTTLAVRVSDSEPARCRLRRTIPV